MSVTHSTAAKNAATDAVTALISTSGKLKFRLSGTIGSPGTAVATLNLSATAFAASSSGTATANIAHGIIGQLGMWMGCASRVTLFLHHIAGVIRRGTDEQVIGIEAARRVAVVADEQSACQVETQEQMGGQAVRVDHALLVADAPIGTTRSVPGPQPTPSHRVNLTMGQQIILRVAATALPVTQRTTKLPATDANSGAVGREHRPAGGARTNVAQSVAVGIVPQSGSLAARLGAIAPRPSLRRSAGNQERQAAVGTSAGGFGRLWVHLDLLMSGATLRAGSDRAGDFRCPNYTMPMGNMGVTT